MADKKIVELGEVAGKYERFLVIGDIHGRFDRLSSVINKVKYSPEKDFLILLGDYTDRGTENLHCLQWAMRVSELPNTVALRGNHEQMMLIYYLLKTYESTIWLPNGGNKTKAEMDKWCESDPDFLMKVLYFIDARPLACRAYVNGAEYIFCHAGLKPGYPLELQEEDSLLWIREIFYNGYAGNAQVVVGHTPTPYVGEIPGMENRDPYYPVKLPNKILMMDTGSFLPKGRISCTDIFTGKIWQSDSNI